LQQSFDDAEEFKNGYAIVRIKEKRGMINKKVIIF